MCGVCGAAGPAADSIPVKEMCRILSHRGPDDEGYLRDDYVVLGHRRLSIIDVAGGRQPMCNEDGSICVVFNGEIYNYVELREELARRHEFRTSSDTEVILHAYEEWGLGFIHKLRGMFAFALYDSKRRLVILARDRLGKKPLYYTMLPDATLVFASELTSFKPLYGGVFPRSTLNMVALAHYLHYGYTLQPETIVVGIWSLPASTMLVYSVDSGAATLIHYWEPLPGEARAPGDPVELVYKLLYEATRIRLRSDVPLSILLSGGLDSTTVASLASKAWRAEHEAGRARYRLRAVTVSFPGTPYDEAELAQLAAEHAGIDHVIVDMGVDEALDIIDRVVKGFDQPFADTSMLPTHMAFKAARIYSKVALTGDGGDEVFLGYPWMLRGCVGLASHLPVSIATRVAELLATRRRLLSAAARLLGGMVSYLNTYLLLDKATVARMTRTSIRAFENLSKLLSRELPSCIDRVDYATIRFYLVNDILVKVDRASMLVSLEARSPMLDQEVVATVTSLPVSVRFGGTRKRLLRQVARRYRLLPEKLLEQPKRGFGAPIEYWIRDIDVEAAADVLKRFGLQGVNEVVARLRRGTKPYHARTLYAIYALGRWLDAHFE